jgi:NADP-dependent 3-hydroxy acid dehydrogenase YdfG
MSNNIEGKVVVITGASSGLGEATAGDETLMKCPAFCRTMWT